MIYEKGDAMVPKSKSALFQYMNAEDPFEMDRLLSECGQRSHDKAFELMHGSESDEIVNSIRPSLSYICRDCSKIDNLRYILTCHEPPSINAISDGGYGATSLHNAVQGFFNKRIKRVVSSDLGKDDDLSNEDDFSNIKILLDFNANRSIRSNTVIYGDLTPLGMARNFERAQGRVGVCKLLEEYFPSEEDKLVSQLASKIQIDELFKKKGRLRYKQAEIDAKFEFVWEKLPVYRDIYRAICDAGEGSLELVWRTILSIQMPFVLYFASRAIEMDQLHLLDCFYERIRCGDRPEIKQLGLEAKEARRGHGSPLYDLLLLKKSDTVFAIDLLEKLLLIGLDPYPQRTKRVICFNNTGNFISKEKNGPPSSVIECTHLSRVLCVVKILFHKYFYFLDMDTIYELIQTLMLEELASPEKEHPDHLARLIEIEEAEKLALRERLAKTEAVRHKESSRHKYTCVLI